MSARPEELAALKEQRDVLLTSLRELERERAAGEIGEADYTTLKDDYTARAATVLRAIDAARSAGPRPRSRPRPGSTAARRASATARRAPRPATAPAGAGGRRHRRSLAITLGVAFAIAAVAGLFVVFSAGGRDPGQPVTGSVPGDSTDRLAQALSLESEGRAVDALKLYDEIIADEPQNAEALAYRGWLLKRAGIPDKALESLDRAVAADPSFPDAHFFRGMVLYQDMDDPAGAVTEFQAFLANDPPPEFVGGVQQVLAKAEAAAAAKAAGGPAPAPPSTVVPDSTPLPG